MKKFLALLTIILTIVLSAGMFAQDTTSTGNTGTGTTGTGMNETDQQQQTGTSESQSMQNDDQQYGTNADDWSQSLTDELKLNASQRDSVRSILLDYQRQRATLNQDMTDTELSQFNSSFNDRISNILEEDQVNSYKSYNQSWWNDINSTISNTGRNNNSDKNQQY